MKYQLKNTLTVSFNGNFLFCCLITIRCEYTRPRTVQRIRFHLLRSMSLFTFIGNTMHSSARHSLACTHSNANAYTRTVQTRNTHRSRLSVNQPNCFRRYEAYVNRNLANQAIGRFFQFHRPNQNETEKSNNTAQRLKQTNNGERRKQVCTTVSYTEEA